MKKAFHFFSVIKKSKICPAYCEFSLSIWRGIEPCLALFQAKRHLAVSLSKVRRIDFVFVERFVKSDILDVSATPCKLLTLDLKSEEGEFDSSRFC